MTTIEHFRGFSKSKHCNRKLTVCNDVSRYDIPQKIKIFGGKLGSKDDPTINGSLKYLKTLQFVKYFY